MKRIARFKEHRVNEEWGITSPTAGEGGGVDWLDDTFVWLGDKLGNEVDILSKYIKDKVEDGSLDEDIASTISKTLLTRVGGKKREQIYKMVDAMIKGAPAEQIS